MGVIRIGSIKRYLKSYARQVFRDFRGYRIAELTKIDVAFVDSTHDRRINLVVLAIRNSELYGGTATAIRLLNSLSPHFPYSRIIVLNESEHDFDSNAWPNWELASINPHGRQTIAFLGKAGQRPDVRRSDYFIATHWLTAHYVIALRDMQSRVTTAKLPPFVYLIQDFEPAFYPWSTRYMLAEATYRHSQLTIAVFNTCLLAEYFDSMGYRFFTKHYFEPRLNPTLAVHKMRLVGHKKKRLILVYGRPGQPRNAFELIVETLIIWAQRYAGANSWQVISLGAQHKDIRLTGELSLQSKGKVSLSDYASYLLDASVGVSLMVSPHPSYPPLEMAEFGLKVITNNFANKDLSTRSRNIISVSGATPTQLADVLMQLCLNFDQERGNSICENTTAFLGNEDEFPFIADLVQVMTSELAD